MQRSAEPFQKFTIYGIFLKYGGKIIVGNADAYCDFFLNELVVFNVSLKQVSDMFHG